MLLPILLCAAVPAQISDVGSSVRTTLTRIRSEPEAYRNVEVIFDVQFASLGEISNPFFTRFTPTDYANLHVWGDEQPIWRKDSYEDLFGTLFYPKSGDQLEAIYRLETYQRLRVHGIVRNTFQQMPWIEITRFEPLPEQVDLAVLTHLYRGETYMAQRKWQRAIAELSLAPSGSAPEAVHRAVHRGLGICYLRIGEPTVARSHLEAAASLTTGVDVELERLIAAARTAPGSEIDRTVDASKVRDYERPMWEAFEENAQPAR
ncbi:MAG: hypothetical protein Fur0037_12070 [Planctomycetota bacterium]